MNFYFPLFFSVFILMFDTKISQVEMHGDTVRPFASHYYEYNQKSRVHSQYTNEDTNKEYSSYTTWSAWTTCRGGHRTRRRHCLQRQVCGDTLSVQVSKCNNNFILNPTQRQPQFESMSVQKVSSVKQKQRQMMNNGVKAKIFRGFSGWAAWSSCSRKCTTVRKRYCRRPTLCGNQVIRQHAYCYVDGTYCQQWIEGKIQRRKDQVYYIIKPEGSLINIRIPDNRPGKLVEPKCGTLGKIKGSPAARTRARMKEMLRIIGGRPAPPGKWPWQVAVLNRYKEAFCGGTLVSLRWIVSAAHCVRRRLYVRLGEHDLLTHDNGEVEMRVADMIVHPHYDPDTVVNDVAMLRLPSPAQTDLGHGIACLPKPMQPLPPHTNCVILGWGKRRPTDIHGTRILHEAQISTIQQNVCRKSYWQYAITENMVCAGRGRRDSCAGDSGGPLLCRDRDIYYLQGITSFGDGCGKRGKYGIYTKTSGYVIWMRTVMDTYHDGND